VHFGPVHTKDSLYARELGFGPMGRHNDDYRKWLTQAGVMSSEMECAHLFILAQLANRPAQKARVLAGGILAVIGDYDEPFTDSPRADDAIALSIELAFGALAELRQP
jgi:uridine phosphorylase